ncbi:excalibur calcium-binding domain-containing protein [Bisgaardia hudsonensis]|uniref:Excalibur calcium-binding domain-containing protein n=1 Tax=Bisgaardia hudsonensis TaxID=109472 RepID=A0A4R2N168_9PAST|nr:excalibur calcium-binding domain-containing protein [Bisgaardia hudsonensis]QLB13150.1 hypothetical protein A6A11_05745 [Bisgaardia hudsonensis]TCP13279.1 excalibur calcium-binding domain-containing protein [Bisgaardia hudsonensis]
MNQYLSVFVCILALTISSSIFAKRVKCKDFSNQAEAQFYMNKFGAYYLDRDKDGEACECLLGGSKYGSKLCKR